MSSLTSNTGHDSSTSAVTQLPGSNTFALTSLTSLFFMWGFITCLNDILIPHLKGVFD
jgi:FHS family L-fucose permease-like MFS transporter